MNQAWSKKFLLLTFVGLKWQVCAGIVMTYWILIYLILRLHGSHKTSELILREVQNLICIPQVAQTKKCSRKRQIELAGMLTNP